MTDNQFNYLRMNESVFAVLGEQQFASIVSGNLKLSALVTGATNNYTSILATAGLQAQVNKGPTLTKDNLFQAAVSKADFICSAVRSYADDSGDLNLLTSMHFTFKGLLRTPVDQAIIDMQLIHDTAAGITIADLLPFNVVAADITALQSAIDAFSAAAPAKRAMVVNSSVATSQLPPLFTEQRKIFKKIDNLVNTFRPTQPVFVDAYFKARKIINYGKTMRAVEMHLMPNSFEAIFGQKFEEGNAFLIRNHSGYEIHAALTDTPSVLPTANLLNVPAQTQIKAEISKGFGGVFGHWLVIINPHSLDDVHATVILSLGPDKGSANLLAGKVK